MGVVGTLLALEIHAVVAVAILGDEALHGSPGFDQDAVHREVLVREQALPFRQARHLVEEQAGDAFIEQSLPPLPRLKSLRDLFDWPRSDLYRVTEAAAPYVGHFHECLVRGGFPQTDGPGHPDGASTTVGAGVLADPAEIEPAAYR